MEALSDVQWDLLISGTGLSQSLLALSNCYGGSEAALSLQDAEDWLASIETLGHSNFRYGRIIRRDTAASGSDSKSSLGFSRSYSLALGPQIIHSRSRILPTLVSSKVYRQLEFLAVGGYWIYEAAEREDGSEKPTAASAGTLSKIPSNREDIFADKSIDLKSKRSLVKFLKLVVEPEGQVQIIQESGSQSFKDYLTERFNLLPRLQVALHALTLLPRSISQTSVSEALPCISTHLRSIGVFGPGFGAVVPKWGGVAEIAQVACRACAVGGATYMLGKGVESISPPAAAQAPPKLDVVLANGDTIQSRWLASDPYELPHTASVGQDDRFVARSISIISSGLGQLFLPSAEGGPAPAAAIAVFPPGSLHSPEQDAPVYLVIHSSDTGECPAGQSIIYASTWTLGEAGLACLGQAVQALLAALTNEASTLTRTASATPAEVLWTLQYQQRAAISTSTPPPSPLLQTNEDENESEGQAESNIITLPGPNVGLTIDDSVLDHVKEAWRRITGSSDGFMEFEDREVGAYDDDDGGDDYGEE